MSPEDDYMRYLRTGRIFPRVDAVVPFVLLLVLLAVVGGSLARLEREAQMRDATRTEMKE